MSLFSFNQEEILTFFAVLVRYSVLIAVLPFFGDRTIPALSKILLSLALAIAIFPALVKNGVVRPGDAVAWGSTASGIVGTIVVEALCALILGFTARFAFDTFTFGGNLVGNFMGFAAASNFDPHQETQSQVVAEFQSVIAMLLFLALDGHHLMLRAALDSYQIVGLGALKSGLGAAFAQKLIELSGQVIRFGIEISAPVAISMFAVNVAFGVMAKAMPQLNVLVLSFAAGAVIGLVVLFLSLPEFQRVADNVFARMGDSMNGIMRAMVKGT